MSCNPRCHAVLPCRHGADNPDVLSLQTGEMTMNIKADFFMMVAIIFGVILVGALSHALELEQKLKTQTECKHAP